MLTAGEYQGAVYLVEQPGAQSQTSPTTQLNKLVERAQLRGSWPSYYDVNMAARRSTGVGSLHSESKARARPLLLSQALPHQSLQGFGQSGGNATMLRTQPGLRTSGVGVVLAQTGWQAALRLPPCKGWSLLIRRCRLKG